MEKEINRIKFIERGFMLYYPDRVETWKRGLDIGIIEGSQYIRYKLEIYKEVV